MRQMHHWAADIFIGSMIVHMARIFFTGAFRKPRELNWTIGVTLLILAILNGFLGYSLPDDLVSGTGIRIAYSIMESIPLAGSYLAFWVFGGNFPGTAVIPRFFIIHCLIIPLVIIGLVGAHLFLLVRQKHTQFPGKDRTEKNVVGSPMYPVFMAKTTGLPLHRGWRHGTARCLRADQPDLAVRSLHRVTHLLRRAAGLVHGLARRGAARLPVLGVHGLRPYHPVRGLDTGGHLPGHRVQPRLRVAAHRTKVHRATTRSTTCSIDHATVRSARRRVSPRSRSWRCSSSRARPTSWRTSSTCRSTRC